MLIKTNIVINYLWKQKSIYLMTKLTTSGESIIAKRIYCPDYMFDSSLVKCLVMFTILKINLVI